MLLLLKRWRRFYELFHFLGCDVGYEDSDTVLLGGIIQAERPRHAHRMPTILWLVSLHACHLYFMQFMVYLITSFLNVFVFFIVNCCMFPPFYCNIFEQTVYWRVLYHLPAPPAHLSLWKPSSPAVPYYATLSVRLLLISIRAFLMRKHWFSLVRVRG